VEGDLDATFKKVIDEAVTTFQKKPDHFLESHRALVMTDENRREENVEEHKALVTTVSDKLGYMTKHAVRYLNTFAKKERTNQDAVANIMVDDDVIAENVPATLLLGLESKLKYIRSVYEAIPTLQPGVNWVLDLERGDNIYKAANPELRSRTEKQLQSIIMAEATKEHPAQVKEFTQDVAIGKITVNNWSGMLSPAEKSILLGRIDLLIRAVKRARQRANTTKVVDIEIGDKLFDFING